MSGRLLKRSLWGALAGLVLLLTVAAGALGLLLYHPAAPGWVLGLARSQAGLQIEADTIEGRLAGPLSLRGLRLEQQERSLGIGELVFDWRPSALLSGRLHLVTLRVSEARLRLPPQAPEQADAGEAAFAGLNLPLAVQIDQLELSDIALEGPGEQSQGIDRLSLVARTRDDSVEIESLALAMPGLALEVGGRIGLSQTLPHELVLNWRFTPPGQVALEGQGGIAGDLQQLTVTQDLSGLLTGRIEARVDDAVGQIGWDARASLQETDLDEGLTGFPLRLAGELRSRGTPAQAGLEADLDLAQPDLGPVKASLRGEYREGGLQLERLLLTTPAGSRVQASGEYRPDADLGRFDGLLEWQALRWPLQGGQSVIESDSGSLQFAGTPGDYDFSLATDLQPSGQPAARLEARGQGNLQGLGLKALQADFQPGRISGQGELSWQPAVKWQLSLQGEGMDPALWVSELPGEIRLAVESRGELAATGLSAEVRIGQLEGRIRDYPVKAEGRARVLGETLEVESLKLNSGDNRFDISGRVGERLALNWRIDAPELEALWPGLAGVLKGSGRVEGEMSAPRVEMALTGEKLAYAQNGIGRLGLEADLDLSNAQSLALDLQAEQLQTAGGSWQALGVTLDGTLPAHRLTLDLRGDKAPGLQLAADAGWRDSGVWTGRLASLVLSLPGQQTWRLAQPADFALGAGTQRLDRLCLHADAASLCGDFERTAADGWQAELEARAFPLASLQPWMPGLQIDGNAELEANLDATAQGRTRGDLRLRLPQGRLGLDLENEAERIDFDGGELSGRLDADGAALRLQLPLAGLGEAQGELTLPGFDPLSLDLSAQTLQGRLDVRLRDLSRLSLLSPRLLNPQGQIRGDFTLAGTLQKPQLTGDAELLAGALDIPELGLELRDIGLKVNAPSQERLVLEGGLSSGKGRLKLNGELELDAEAGFPGRLQLSGSQVQVANLPQAEVEVSPELTLERERLANRLKGQIEIPYARLRPRKLPATAVTASSDLVLVNGDGPEKKAIDPRLYAELRVVMGDRVSFDGFGLRGNLTGSLLVIDEPKRPVLGRGRIGIENGTYKAYGQDLSIERGYANFVDSPVDNPGLDVRAVREIDEVIAGVKVGGTLKKPQIDLFSSPSMSESDTLSYLLTGRPAGEGGGESVGIAAALKATGAGTVAEELGRQFGLEELRFDAGSGMEEASVVAGTYLSPRLYIQYVNELTSRETKLRLRYDINKRLQLEAETGNTQAGDLFYTFDR